MTKENLSPKDRILSDAADMASLKGLDGVTIGALAARTGMSKSGLFRHFGSKEQLQVETLRAGVNRFVELVIRPALSTKRGTPRLRSLFDRWMDWETKEGLAGGCIFVAAAVELDDQPGAARDFLVKQQSEWLSFLETTVAKTMACGDLPNDVNAEQFAFEFHSILLGFHFVHRLLEDPKASDRACVMFERLLSHPPRRQQTPSEPNPPSETRSAGPPHHPESDRRRS